ncbi:MAG: oligosaccharide flippase family protein [Rhodobacteraceae bacterium]|nr:oligosaccharide flippase family protein [Paracoccaceae bacterium]
MNRISGLFKGQSLMQRAMRSSAITILGYGGGQVLRLISNLILTRLLFPEAFGVMAMVTVILMGLVMFSDMGVGPAIMQSKRGDDPDYLDTAWTIQIIRGVLLWLGALALAVPVAGYFGEPALVWYLPVSSLSLILNGFNPTRLETANRHLRAGRVTMLELGSQATGIIIGVVLALIFKSVWALVISGVLTAAAWLIYLNLFLPGHRNRLRWEPTAAHELIHFGKWIFLATLCGFAIGQADKVIVGNYLSTHDFGIYNIGYFLASFPLMLGSTVTRRVLIPVYRDSPPAASRENFLRLRKLRIGASAVLVFGALLLALIGVWLVQLMYDDRYFNSAGVVVLFAIVQIPAIIVLTYDQAALASGDSKRFFVLALVRSVLMVTMIMIGLNLGGLPGALFGQGAAYVLAYPVVVWLARREGAWDPAHDALFAAIGLIFGTPLLWLHWENIAALANFVPG